MLFREAVIGLIVGETEAEKQTRIGREYCAACRRTGRDTDCGACSRIFEEMTKPGD